MSFAADDDLSAEAEEKLGDHFGIPVFVKNYPFSKKAFYMKALWRYRRHRARHLRRSHRAGGCRRGGDLCCAREQL